MDPMSLVKVYVLLVKAIAADFIFISLSMALNLLLPSYQSFIYSL
jgi:hypothetical protein